MKIIFKKAEIDEILINHIIKKMMGLRELETDNIEKITIDDIYTSQWEFDIKMKPSFKPDMISHDIIRN